MVLFHEEPVMKSEITRNANGIEIDITDVEGRKDKLLEAFHECSEGRCTCPTQEYEKMETLDITDTGDSIQLSIKAKDGDEIDTKEIEKCLEYTKKRVSAE
jgi:hypothetical protein